MDRIQCLCCGTVTHEIRDPGAIPIDSGPLSESYLVTKLCSLDDTKVLSNQHDNGLSKRECMTCHLFLSKPMKISI